jgi:histidine ammonia-lyase
MKKTNFLLTGNDLTVEQVYKLSSAKKGTISISLHPEALKRMKKSQKVVAGIANSDKPVYGINTGFGALASKFIPRKDIKTLQLNLIRSHCTGVGEPFSREITRAIMILRANCLAHGNSGINPEFVELILDFLNEDVLPVIPEKGSVGASGDLAPLAHMALCLIGEGEVNYLGKIIPTNEALKKIKKKALVPGAKDGLALINGTAVMAALGSLALYQSKMIMKLADITSCLTLEGVRGSMTAYHPGISALKPHRGQLDSSKNLNALLKGSEIIKSHKNCGKVQDPYSLRCVPQVHGACRQTVYHAQEVIGVELNSVTDNPLILDNTNEVVSGGNFHGEALALCMDYLSMGLAEIGNISERRIEKMMNPTFSDLPAFLTKDSGLNSGLMIAHVTAAALASENKYLCHPASIDSIPTSTDKEDHVSMGVTSGRKLHEVLTNVKHILAIELLCASQAIELGRPLKSTKALETAMSLIRREVSFIEADRRLDRDILSIFKLIDSGELLNSVEKILGELC